MKWSTSDSASLPGKVLGSCHPMGDPEDAPLLWRSPASANDDIWAVINGWKISHCFSFSPYSSPFQKEVNKSVFKEAIYTIFKN